MAITQKKIERMISQIDEIISATTEAEHAYSDLLARVHERYRFSARNLIHYATLRNRSLRKLQRRLANLGFSRLAKAESHLMPSLETTRQLLQILSEERDKTTFVTPEISIRKSKRLLKSNVAALLNKRPRKRRSRIMVTMPKEAAHDRQLIDGMLRAGMNVARINCAHDNPEIWMAMIENLKASSAELQIPCLISMDLAGPKIRTGAIEPGPQIKKVRPPKNARGMVIQPSLIWLGFDPPPVAQVVLPLEQAKGIKASQLLYFRDARKKKRSLLITQKSKTGYLAETTKTCYFETGMKLYADAKRKNHVATIGELPPLPGHMLLRTGDKIAITREPIIAKHREQSDGTGHNIAQIACTNGDVIDQVQAGEPVVLDDGKFHGKINEVHDDYVIIELLKVRSGGAKLRADKGINFPKSDLSIRGLTEKDREDLEFVVRHADIVNMSFVNTVDDVQDLIDAISNLTDDPPGVVFKIETARAYLNLTSILLTGMQLFPIGIMIARGDLALEVGWKNIGAIQREIMKVCHAAHVPDIWATQVFENLAKQGIPSRAEMTDVWVAQRSECVMLNKGPYIIEAIQLLNDILTKMEPYRDKDEDMLPTLSSAAS